MPPLGAGMSPAHGPFGRRRDRVVNSAITRSSTDTPSSGPTRFAPSTTSIRSRTRSIRCVARDASSAHLPGLRLPRRAPENARYAGPILDDPAGRPARPGPHPRAKVRSSSSPCPRHSRTTWMPATDHRRAREPSGARTRHDGAGRGARRDPCPRERRVVASAPHSEVLPRADLVVTDGGHGTVMKILAAGVPLVILHHGRDQAETLLGSPPEAPGIAVPRRATLGSDRQGDHHRARRPVVSTGRGASRAIDHPRCSGQRLARGARTERLRPSRPAKAHTACRREPTSSTPRSRRKPLRVLNTSRG